MALVTHAGRKVALPAGLGELEHDDYDDVLEDIEHEDLTRGAQTTAEAEGDDDLEDDDALKLIDSKDTIHEVCNLLGDAKMAKVLDVCVKKIRRVIPPPSLLLNPGQGADRRNQKLTLLPLPFFLVSTKEC